MGGIAGMIRFDGQAIDPTDTNSIIKLLKHRGDVVSQPIDTGLLISFGGTAEISPAISVIADADVFSTTFTGHPFSTGYSQTGPESFNEVNADFAIALWDAHQKLLFCARDAMGTKPLYYVHQPNRFFAFASEIKALITLRDVIVEPNRHKFREYLTWQTSYVHYSAETFYETIYSVLPGHYLQVSAQRVAEHSYWRVNFSKFTGLHGIEDYSAIFHDQFTTAVDARMRNKKRVGSHLSGGLDSSSVSCVAQSLLIQQRRPSLHTFNIDTEQPSAEEQAYVLAVVDQWHVSHHKVHPLADVLDSVLKIHHQFDRPEQFIIPSSFHLSVSIKAQELGCDTMLTGHDGDSVITTGFEFINDLIDNGQWDEFKLASQQLIAPRERNIFTLSDNWPELSAQAKYEKYVLSVIGSHLKKQFRHQPLSGFLAMVLAHKKRFGLSETAIMTYIYGRIKSKLDYKTSIDSALSEDFKRQVPPRPQLSTEKLVKTLSAENHVAFEEVLNNTNVICNEQMNHIGAYYGHAHSYPFFDKNIVELGLATPMAVRFASGRGRGLIRHGLRDVLPPAILTRYTKANFVEYGTLSAQQLYEATRELFSVSSHPIWDVVDRHTFDKILAIVYNPRFPAGRKTRFNWLLSRIIYLSLWLGALKKPDQSGNL